ncbi:MAG: dienelactone hydrolase family protein [Solirubrobacteraceae bacterium]
MLSATIDMETPDGVADGYLSRPECAGTHPGVLFIIDAFGLRPRTKAMADRIAAEGYVVIAPNVFYRAGRAPLFEMPDLSAPGAREQLLARLRPLMEQLSPAAIALDGGVYLDHLQRLAPGTVAITGYCMGGRVGWRIATAHPDRVAALASFHGGGFVTDAPDSPHRSARALRAELYLGHADNDQSMTPEMIAELDQALDQAAVRYRSELYEGAVHGYTMSDTPVYNEPACERHFRELFALLQRAVAA